MSSADPTTRGSRARSIQDWLARRADSPVGRLSLQWFRAYFAASRNSGCAVTIYSALSVFPAVLVFLAYFHPSGGSTNVFADHLIDHLNLNGSTASLVHDAFGSASSNALAATVATAVSFLLWGIGIGQIYQDVYSRAWGIKVGSMADQGLFAIFFFVLSGAAALAIIASTEFQTTGWLFLIPAWIVGSVVFWLWVPRFLLHRQVGLRALFPGALLASLLLGGTAATSPLFLAAPLNSNAKTFGAFGVVVTVIGYAFVMLTMSLAAAVFSPVWAEWRKSERARTAAAGTPDVA
jgi:hypothetical protein